MKKWMIRIRENLQSNKGFTMVEMVVTIILTGILFTMACTMLLSWGKSYDKLKTIEHAEQLTDTLMDKISGEISGAQDRNIPDHTKGTENLDHVIISADNTEIELYDRTGSHIKISAIESTPGDASTKELNIHYYEVKNLAGDDNLYDAVDWKYSKKMYMNYYVQELRFDTVKGKTGNLLPLVDVTLKVRNEKYQYTCTVTKTIECYNSPTISGPGGGTPDPPPIDPDNPPVDPDNPPIDPDNPPVDPDNPENPDNPDNPDYPVPPEEPDVDREHGYIEIVDGKLEFFEGKPSFQDLKDKAESLNPPNDTEIIQVPAGIYYDKATKTYYFVTEDTVTDKYDCGSMGQIKNYTGNWNKVIELLNDKLVTEKNITPAGQFDTPIKKGSIYYYQKEYYICVEPSGGQPGINPAATSFWVKVESRFISRSD